MQRRAVIVISIDESSWAKNDFREKLLGNSADYYYFDPKASTELQKIIDNESLPSIDNSTIVDFPFFFLAATHGSDEESLEEMVLGRCALAEQTTNNGDDNIILLTCNAVALNGKRCPRPVKNLRRTFNLDLGDNFSSTGFVKIEISETAADSVEFYLAGDEGRRSSEPSSHGSENLPSVQLAKFASPKNKASRLFCESRACADSYRIDYERIIQSKAFRRLVDKAQVFTSSKGDHYRTRMTHTLEVARIARLLAEQLNANVELAEAIALAHDIGHTPFGHQGERSLNDILRRRCPEITPMLFSSYETSCNPYGGFKHNFQSVRVLCSLEERFPEFQGLNLSAQVLEGALWHTSAPKKECGECLASKTTCCEKEGFWNVSHDIPSSQCRSFWNYVFHDGEYKGISHSLTFEGQIVAIADEIAQRGHDIEDALTAGAIGIDELLDLSKIRSIDNLHETLKEIDAVIENESECGRLFVNRNRLRKSALSSKIIGYLVKSAIDGTSQAASGLSAELDPQFGPLLHEELVTFDESGEAICDYLKHVVTSRVLASQEVSRFDGKGKMIVEGLFKAYYTQPRLLPITSLRRLAIVEQSNRCPAALDLSNCDFDLGTEELKEIKSANIDNLPPKRRKKSYQMSSEEESALKKKILARCIVDHISGMTDSYAAAEYEKIYGTSL